MILKTSLGFKNRVADLKEVNRKQQRREQNVCAGGLLPSQVMCSALSSDGV